MRKLIYITFLLIFLFLLNACDDLNKKNVKVEKDQKPKILTQAEKEQLLKKRVNDFWLAKVNNDRGIQYDMHDPFFRARISRESYISMGNNIFYENPQILEVILEDNVAKVKMSFVYFGELMGRLKPVKIDKTYAETVQTWLFLDGNWYLEFVDNINEITYAVY